MALQQRIVGLSGLLVMTIFPSVWKLLCVQMLMRLIVPMAASNDSYNYGQTRDSVHLHIT